MLQPIRKISSIYRPHNIIRVPRGVQTELAAQFRVSRPFVSQCLRLLRGGTVAHRIRERALEMGGTWELIYTSRR